MSELRAMNSGRKALTTPIRSWALAVPISLLAVTPLASCGPAPKATAEDLAACDSDDARDLVKKALEENAASPQISIKVLDFTNPKEVSFDKDKPERHCTATVTLNTGEQPIQYRLWYSSDQNLLVAVRPDTDADTEGQ